MSAIPASLTKAHVVAAIAQIDREGVPARRQSTKFHLVVNGRHYPPKYVISLAVAQLTGRELPPHEFSGGEETNGYLQSLGFTVVEPGRSTPKPPRTNKPAPTPRVSGATPKEPKAPPASRVENDVPQSVVRVVVDGEPASSWASATEMLLEAFERWPVVGRTKFAITPGGFLHGDFPARWTGGVSWDSSPDDLEALVRAAKPVVNACVTKKVLAAARARMRVLTIGVDLLSESDDGRHAELVAVIDCGSGNIVRWTGKSYPVSSQERTLVQVADLESHFIEIADERVLVLGCHDLNMFSGRARANQTRNSVRWRRCNAMAKATARFRPTVVLQHPHSTDTPRIWQTAWGTLVRDYPSVRVYASGVGYYNWSGFPRGPLQKVLDGTRSETGVADVIVGSR